MAEVELQFHVPAAALVSLRQPLQAKGARRSRMRVHRFDTADGALARHHLALSLRLQGRGWVQSLQADAGAQRPAHEVPVPGPARLCPTPDLRRHAGSEAWARLAAALGTAADPTLTAQWASDVWRLQGQATTAGGSVVAWVLDVGRLQAGTQAVPVSELRLQHQGGALQGLFDLAATCVQLGGLWQTTGTQAQRGQRLRAGGTGPGATRATRARGTSRATRATAPQLHAGTDGPALLRAMLHAALQQVLANASELAAGDAPDASGDTTETIHQLRVGLRRLRVVLRELAPLCSAVQPDWNTALARTFASLGALRDPHAAAAAVRPLLLAAAAPVTAWPAADLPDAVATARDPGLQTVLLAVQALAHADDAPFAALSAHAVRKRMAKRLQRLHARVTSAARGFEQLPLDPQHAVRKQLKRLRYLAELTADLWPAPGRHGSQGLPGLKSTLRRLARAQEALGLHHDVALAAAAFRQQAPRHPEAWFAAGYLQAHLAVTARAARKTLCTLARKPCPWR